MTAQPITLHVGTYTSGASRGIYRVELDPETGAVGEPAVAAEAVNPAFLAWHPRLPVLYAVSGRGSNQQGLVIAFAAASDGSLAAIGEQPSGGAGPCYVSVDASGARVFVANYHGGSVAALPIDADGRLLPPSSIVRHSGSSVHPVRQRKAYAHSIIPAPASAAAAAPFALAADLGIDRIVVYRIDDASGHMTPHDGPASAPGAGPRHLAFTPASGSDAVFAINELNSTIAAYAWNSAHGTLEPRGEPVSTLPDDFAGENLTAEIAVHPDGRFLYGSNRGHDSIAIFRIGAISSGSSRVGAGSIASDHHLTRIGLHTTDGRTPRHFAIDPTGAFLLAANQDSDSLVVFRIDRGTGLLSDPVARAHVPTPSCVRFRPAIV